MSLDGTYASRASTTTSKQTTRLVLLLATLGFLLVIKQDRSVHEETGKLDILSTPQATPDKRRWCRRQQQEALGRRTRSIRPFGSPFFLLRGGDNSAATTASSSSGGRRSSVRHHHRERSSKSKASRRSGSGSGSGNNAPSSSPSMSSVQKNGKDQPKTNVPSKDDCPGGKKSTIDKAKKKKKKKDGEIHSHRIRRLLTLLEIGSSPQIRLNAAVQLGGVVDSEERKTKATALFDSILKHCHKLLRNKNWDTRTAGAEAIQILVSGRILRGGRDDSNVGEGGSSSSSSSYEGPWSEFPPWLLGLDDLSIPSLLARNLSLERHALDNAPARLHSTSEEGSVKRVAEQTAVLLSLMPSSLSDSPAAPAPSSPSGSPSSGSAHHYPLVVHGVSSALHDIFHPDWERRHGGALGLKAYLRAVSSAEAKLAKRKEGKAGDCKRGGAAQETEGHVRTRDGSEPAALWCERAAARCLCVLALERFVDQAGDESVLPICESVAQALSMTLRFLPAAKVRRVADVLIEMSSMEPHVTSEWQVRYSGWVGIKYLLSLFPEHQSHIVPKIVNLALKQQRLGAFHDSSEPVGGKAAEALLSAIPYIKQNDPKVLAKIANRLWEKLRVISPGSSEAASFMDLVTECVAANNDSSSSSSTSGPPSLSSANLSADRLKRIFPFMTHILAYVRKASLRAIRVLSSPPSSCAADVSSDDYAHPPIFSYLYQMALTEQNEKIRDIAMETVTDLTQRTRCSSERGSASDVNGGGGQRKGAGAPGSYYSPYLSRFNATRWLKIAAIPDGYRLPDHLNSVLRVTDTRTALPKLIEATPANTGTFEPILSLRARLDSVKVVASMIATGLPAMTAASRKIPEWVGDMVLELMRDSNGGQGGGEGGTRKGNAAAGHSGYRFGLASELIRQFLASFGHSDRSAWPTEIWWMIRSESEKPLPHRLDDREMYIGRVLSSSLACSYACGSKHDSEILFATLEEDKDEALREIVASSIAHNLKATCHLAPLSPSSPSSSPPPSLSLEIQQRLKHMVSARLHFESRNDDASEESRQTSSKDMDKRPGKSSSKLKKTTEPSDDDSSSPDDDALDNESRAHEETFEAERMNRTYDGAVAVMRKCGELFSRDYEDLLSKLELVKDSLNTLQREMDTDTADTALYNQAQRPSSSSTRRSYDAEAIYFGLVVLETFSSECSEELLHAHLGAVLKSATNGELPDCIRTIAASVYSNIVVRVPGVALNTLAQQMPKIMQKDSVRFGKEKVGVLKLVGEAANRTKSALIPYSGILTLPVLAAMADQSKMVREEASRAFAALVHILPLEPDAPNPPFMSHELAAKRVEAKEFVRQLLEGARAEEQTIPVQPEGVKLRRYQFEGVSWLLFLKKFGLHGALCDDMGLGKTLQAACVLAAYKAEMAGREGRLGAAMNSTAGVSKSVSSSESSSLLPRGKQLPSLILCPPSLVFNWMMEIRRFFPGLAISAYSSTDRVALRKDAKSLEKTDALIMSYQTYLAENQALKDIAWGYCILDEGHVIRNAKTKLSKAVASIRARHRLMLSGTPVHNSAVELYTIFNFLMPGYLGDAAHFRRHFENPIRRAAGDGKKKLSAAVQEAGALAMEKLHKAVLMFILRRTKDEVLTELPPKIIQDILCEMAPLQAKIYSNIAAAASELRSEENPAPCSSGHNNSVPGQVSLNATLDAAASLPKKRKEDDSAMMAKPAANPLKMLSLLQRACVHPAMMAKAGSSAAASLLSSEQDLMKVEHSGKFVALLQLFKEGGLVASDSSEGGDGENAKQGAEEGAVAIRCLDKGKPTSSFQRAGTRGDERTRLTEERAEGPMRRRFLIFAQHQKSLDLVESLVLKQRCMQGVRYMRLDGTTPEAQRPLLANQFNNDSSIDLMLLTTHVGGLGLTLTGADTVVFLEHDWNPQNDIQAMDRAHRIGQTKTVTVYRLIMKDSVEERIMGAQRFKLQLANTIVNTENLSMKTMDTNRLIDAIGSAAAASSPKKRARGSGGMEGLIMDDAASRKASKGGGLQQMLEELGDLSDEEHYQEFNITAFKQNFNSPRS